MSAKIFVSIAVSRPQKLEALPGAIQASQAMIGWAKAAGFITESITDKKDNLVDEKDNLVTVSNIRAILMPLLTNTEDVIEHFIFHFVGHGLASGAEDQFLLLSQWRSRPDEAIKLGRFVRLLQFYQPTRVSLFIDACRSRLKPDADELNGSGILDRPEEEAVEFLEDRFRAAAAGADTYMIRDRASGVSHCLFSSVLLKALCGKYSEAIDTRKTKNVVTSAKIYGAVNHHLPLEAARYRASITPSLKPSFVPPNDIYTYLPIAFEPPDLPTPRLPATSAPPVLDFDWVPISDSEGPPPGLDVHQKVRTIKSAYASERRPTHFATGAGLAITGADLRENPSATPPLQANFDNDVENGTWWQFAGPQSTLTEPGSFVAEITTGSIVGAAAIPRMIATISIGGLMQPGTNTPQALMRGATSVIYRPSKYWSSDQDLGLASKASEDVITRMRAGTLTAEEALSVAAKIRGDKHVNPMLGVIAAYLYDAIGDRDSIRRIAWFYAREPEPQFIPFDVALLADLKGKRGKDGRLRVRVPAVSQRAPRTPDEAEHPDYFCATTEIDNSVVAGGFPWLRQGWSLLDVVSLPVHPELVHLASSLLPFPFTTLEADAGRVLAALVRQGEV